MNVLSFELVLRDTFQEHKEKERNARLKALFDEIEDSLELDADEHKKYPHKKLSEAYLKGDLSK